jgi:hypothetical protein
MSRKLITANPNDNSATVVCKNICVEPSSFMGRFLLLRNKIANFKIWLTLTLARLNCRARHLAVRFGIGENRGLLRISENLHKNCLSRYASCQAKSGPAGSAPGLDRG